MHIEFCPAAILDYYFLITKRIHSNESVSVNYNLIQPWYSVGAIPRLAVYVVPEGCSRNGISRLQVLWPGYILILWQQFLSCSPSAERTEFCETGTSHTAWRSGGNHMQSSWISFWTNKNMKINFSKFSKFIK